MLTKGGKILLSTIFAFYVLDYVCGFLIGYSIDTFAFGFLGGIIFWLLFLVGMIVGLVFLVWLIIAKKPFKVFLIGWCFLLIISFFPRYLNRLFNSAVQGSLVSLYFAGPEKVVQEGRQLIEAYRLDVKKQGLPKSENKLGNSKTLEPESIPPAIKHLHPCWVLVTENEVVVKKYGLGDLAGFYILPPDQTTSGIKLRDGIYWVDASMY